jgi:hypothetical protein
MTACSMSCCQNPDRPVVTALAFVLPPLGLALTSIVVFRATQTMHAIEIPGSIRPLSPPPRIAGAAR